MQINEIKQCLNLIKAAGFCTIGLAGSEIGDESILGNEEGKGLLFVIQDPSTSHHLGSCSPFTNPRTLPELRKNISQISELFGIEASTDFVRKYGDEKLTKIIDNFYAFKSQYGLEPTHAPHSPGKKSHTPRC